jgi:Uma2 family endonuclease
MTALPQTRLTVDDFLAWSESQPGRYELVDGVVVAQAAERAAHAKIKGEVFVALRDAIAKRGAPCHALPDGMAVRVNKFTVYEPDALVYCGPELPPDALLLENPMIVVEVVSPSTSRNDALHKLSGYFSLASVVHYLIVYPDESLVIHHRRIEDGKILTSILREGVAVLDPPGLEFELWRLYGAPA